jgi:hypothetical protein
MAVPAPIMHDQPVLVIELPREFLHPTTSCRYFQQPVYRLDMKLKLSTRRWRYIGRFLFVYTNIEQVGPSPPWTLIVEPCVHIVHHLTLSFHPSLSIMQVYFADRLDIPHYQMSATALPSFLESIATFVTKTKRASSLSVVHLRNEDDHFDDHLNVFNTLSESMNRIVRQLPLAALAEEVLNSEQLDEARGNKFVDTGFSSDQNSKRSSLHGGVATPNKLKRTGEKIFQDGMLGLTELCDLACQPKSKGKVFVDSKREKLCAGSLVAGNRVEAFRAALTNSSARIVDCHADNHNDTSPYFQGVITYSKWLLLSDGDWWRLTLIGYSRKSLRGFVRRRDLYMPLVERVFSYYQAMPDSRKFITPALLDFSDCDDTVSSKRIKPHANKCVYYSIFVHCISRLQRTLKLSVWHVLALVYNTISSETPDYFVTVTKEFLTSTPSLLLMYRSLSPIGLATRFYCRIFDLKEKHKRDGSAVPGQRHQPHYNTRQPDSTVSKSVLNFFRLYLAFQHLDDYLASDPHYYSKAVGILVDSYATTGVYGAGGLTAQHLIHIGVLCGLFPRPLMLHAEIGANTNSYTYLHDWERLTEHKEDTRQLLGCLSNRLELPALVTENIVCKFGQDQVNEPPKPIRVQSRSTTYDKKRPVRKRKQPVSPGRKRPWPNAKKKSPYRDSIYRGQPLFFLEGQSKSKLVKVTAKGSFFVKTILSRCYALDASKHTVPVEPVPFSFWATSKVNGVRPMKNGSRKRVRARNAMIDGEAVHLLEKKLKQPPKEKKAPLKARANEQLLNAVIDREVVLTSENKPKQSTGALGDGQRRSPLQQIGGHRHPPKGKQSNITLAGERNASPSSRLNRCSKASSVALKTQHLPKHSYDLMNPRPEPVQFILPVVSPIELDRQGFELEFAIPSDGHDVPVYESSDGYVVPLDLGEKALDLDEEAIAVLCSLSTDLSESTMSVPICESESLIVPCERILSSHPDSRKPLRFNLMAMRALCLPKFRREYVKFNKLKVRPPHLKGRAQDMIAASLSILSDGATLTKTWTPASDCCPKLISALFSSSLVAKDGIRYHESGKQASKYCFVQGILSGDRTFIKHLLSEQRYELAVFFDPADTMRVPIAAVSRNSFGESSFTFLDPTTCTPVGKRLCESIM